MVDIYAEDPLSSPLELGPDGGPRKLKGEEIPLGGRIVSVADVYDALISKRVYKEPWDSGKVYDEIRSMSGTKLIPRSWRPSSRYCPRIKEIRAAIPTSRRRSSRPAPIRPRPASGERASASPSPRP